MSSVLAIDPLAPWIAVPVGIIAGFLLAWFIFGLIPGNTISRAKRESQQIIRSAEAEGEAARQRIELDAEKKSRERREVLDKEIATALADL
ncbi:MAG: hypothetical protein L0219_16850, partial [Phycisphaerales bacterium]|nr:hypothetical protein [Phycisphaerales bacterium]